jgi:hypothetical protein
VLNNFTPAGILRSRVTRDTYHENLVPAKILKLRIGDDPGFGNLWAVGSSLHFFNSACQFCTTVNCCGPLDATGSATRNRFPSAVTAAALTLAGN